MYDNKFPILSWRRIIIDGEVTPYIISDKGYVMNDSTGRFMLMTLDKDKYPTVKLFVNGKDTVYKVHRLVCAAFNDNPFKLSEVDHINRNHWDASKENLEYVSGYENIQRLTKLREIEKSQLGNYKKVAADRLRYTELQILQVCLRLTKGEDIKKISKKTEVDVKTILRVKQSKIFRNISCYFTFNEDDGGIFDKETLDIIYEYIDRGFTNIAILSALNINYPEYFNDILDKIRIVHNN